MNSLDGTPDTEDVVKIVGHNTKGFSALRADGSIITWGRKADGGDSSAVNFAGGVTQVATTGESFAAIKSDGPVVAWGSANDGGVIPAAITGMLDGTIGAVDIVSSFNAYTVLRADGSALSWGYSNGQAHSFAVAAETAGPFTSIKSTTSGVIGVLANGMVTALSRLLPFHWQFGSSLLQIKFTLYHDHFDLRCSGSYPKPERQRFRDPQNQRLRRDLRFEG